MLVVLSGSHHWNDVNACGRSNVTLHGKTDTNAFPLNGLEKRL